MIVNSVGKVGRWLYYRQWQPWELVTAVVLFVLLLFVLLLLWIAKPRQKAWARAPHADSGPEGASVTGARKTRRMKKYIVLAIIIAGLLALDILRHRGPNPTDGFYLRSRQTGKLIGPISLPKGQRLPSLDEETYIVTVPTESELNMRRMLKGSVTATMTDVPLNELVRAILAAYLGNKAPPVRIELADESKMSRVSIDMRNAPLYEVLCSIASQANVYMSIDNGTIVLSERESNLPQASRNTIERKIDNSGNVPKPQAALRTGEQ